MGHYTEDEIFAYLDKELAPDARDEFESHLGSCADCRCLKDQCESLLKLFSQAPQPADSEDFVAAVMNRITSKQDVEHAPSIWEIIRSWALPGLQFAVALLLLATQLNSADASVDTDMVLLAGLDGEVVQEDLNPLPFDFDTAFGISSEGL